MSKTALNHIITWAKLDGYWVLRGPESAMRPGATVQVSKKDGTTSDEVVVRVLMVKDGIAYAEHQPKEKPKTSAPKRMSKEEFCRTYPRTGCSCGSREGWPKDSDCWTCQHDA